MKLNKQISELVQTNFVPVEEANEGLLRGGFGEISMEEVDLSGRSINFVCKDETILSVKMKIVLVRLQRRQPQLLFLLLHLHLWVPSLCSLYPNRK